MIDWLTVVVDSGDPEQAEAFREWFDYASFGDLGYTLGYLGRDRMIKGLRLFGLSHPAFGDADHAELHAPLSLGQGTGRIE